MISTECMLLFTIVKLMSVTISQAMLSPGPSIQGMTLKAWNMGVTEEREESGTDSFCPFLALPA